MLPSQEPIVSKSVPEESFRSGIGSQFRKSHCTPESKHVNDVPIFHTPSHPPQESSKLIDLLLYRLNEEINFCLCHHSILRQYVQTPGKGGTARCAIEHSMEEKPRTVASTDFPAEIRPAGVQRSRLHSPASSLASRIGSIVI